MAFPIPLRRPTRIAVALCAFTIIHSSEDASAQGVGTVSLDVENDYFDFRRAPDRRSDDNYTQGIHAGVWLATSPGWLRRSVPSCAQSGKGGPRSETCLSSKLLIGQELYTPTNDSPIPLAGERPYAALLYLDLSVAPIKEKSLSVYTIRVGTTGHAALGDEAQKWFHRLIPQFRAPLGWSHQIRTQPVIAASYQYQRLIVGANRSRHHGITLAPSATITAGNLLIAAKGAIDAQAGYRVPHPWMRTGEKNSGGRAYLLAGVQGEWVGYSLLLEGNTSETRNLIKTRMSVAQWYGGLSFGLSRAALDFRIVTRTREYETAPARHVWGTIGMSYRIH